MSQKESEWDKTIKEVADELWELLPSDFFYKNVDRKTMYNWIKSRLENLISNREKEIAEEVEKAYKEKSSQLHGGYDDADYLNAYGMAIHDVLQLLKH
jgi:hypothetical protein